VPNQALGKKEKGELLQEVLERGKAFPEPYKTYIEATDMETPMLRNFF